MDPSLFRCSYFPCSSRGALSIDKFGVLKDGTRKQTCISCCESRRLRDAASRSRRRDFQALENQRQPREPQRPARETPLPKTRKRRKDATPRLFPTSVFTPAFDLLLNARIAKHMTRNGTAASGRERRSRRPSGGRRNITVGDVIPTGRPIRTTIEGGCSFGVVWPM
ncbi:hypothetical protein DL98DRAFT_542992 [Cadophora sp. DSE1049]|nr:hypothetical protein DL98DRAFT_542992 [Cadophora sp. DSE1049]